jgi:hypothetical protein
MRQERLNNYFRWSLGDIDYPCGKTKIQIVKEGYGLGLISNMAKWSTKISKRHL